MSSFEETLSDSLASGLLPGAAFLAVDSSGNFRYNKSVGVRSTKPEAKEKPFTPDTVLSIASCTKLFTGIAAMQCVERGLVQLDEDVATLLPELAKPEILSGFDEATDKPILTPATKPITLRSLLSHSSGFAYDLGVPSLLKWRTQRGEIPWSGKTIQERFTYPLLFEPGSSWVYGSGTDWAGKLIERATNSTLEEFMNQNIWIPLGLKSTSFWPAKNPDLARRQADVSMLSPEDGKTAVPQAGFDAVNGNEDCLAGGGSFASANDFLIVLQAVLHRDPKLLKESSWEELCADQLGPEPRAALQDLLRISDQANIVCGMHVPRDGSKSWSLAGILSLDEYPGGMGKNTLLWGGITSIIWFVDRERGLCGLGAAQVLAFGEPPIYNILGLYLKEVYKKYLEGQTGSASK